MRRISISSRLISGAIELDIGIYSIRFVSNDAGCVIKCGCRRPNQLKSEELQNEGQPYPDHFEGDTANDQQRHK